MSLQPAPRAQITSWPTGSVELLQQHRGHVMAPPAPVPPQGWICTPLEHPEVPIWSLWRAQDLALEHQMPPAQTVP